MSREDPASDEAVFEQLSRLRSGLVQRMWRSFFVISVLLLPLLVWRCLVLWRGEQVGSLLTNAVFLAVATFMVLAYPLRQRLSLAWQAAMPILILTLVGFSSVLVFGAASTAFGWLVQSNFLVATLYSLRAGILATALTALVALVVGALFLSGVLVNSVDLNAYFAQPTTWLLFLLGTTVVPTVIVYAIGGYQKTIGNLLSTVQAKRDELKHMSQRLAEALRAQERANAAKNTFLAHMTHELRTPLSGVIGMLEIAEKRNADPSLGRLLDVARSSAEAQLRIINDVLDFSRLDAGKVTLAPAYFDLRDFITTSLAVFHWRAREKGLVFRCHIDEPLAGVRQADPGRLRQVLFNLISNAMKFTELGSVTLEVRQPPGASAEDDRVLFTLRDTGMGIAADALPRLFGQFEQVDASVHQRFGGTGLGLAISKALIEAMHGTISVQSAVGVGTVFEVVLPLPLGTAADLVSPPDAPGQVDQPQGVQLNVLLADDALTNQLVVSMQLQEMGHRVVVADNGLMAVELAARENFDLILMDLRMPVLAGCEAAAMIRQGGSPQATVFDRDLFICALSANTTPQEHANALSVGMNEFLVKPVRAQCLRALIDRVIVFQRQRGIPLSQAPLLAADSSSDLAWAALTPSPASAAVGQTRQQRLQSVFRIDLAEHLQTLVKGATCQQWPQVGDAAHVIKGAALAVAVPHLGALAAQLEMACAGPEPAAAQALAAQLIADVTAYLEGAA